MVKDQEIASLQHKLGNAEGELEKLEGSLKEHKSAKEESSATKDTNENLGRKIALLEEELDNAEKNLRETTDKCVTWLPSDGRAMLSVVSDFAHPRLACAVRD